MIIKNIKIKKFGVLKDKEIEFKEGINIINGENEAGKTTLQHFIKAFLYGMNSKRGKSIRDNSRARYVMFDGERASGEMELEHNGENIIIIRSFGSSKKEDTIKVINELTGTEVGELNHNELAKTMININSESFDNTAFIKSLGTYLNSSKDDEIMNKLTNSLESGEEGVSYFKALAKLEAIRKALTTARGNGKLDVLREKKISILEEREQFLKASDQNLEDEMKRINLRGEISTLRLKLKKLEVFKKHLKKIKLQKEYKDILQYLKKSEELKSKAKAIDGELEAEEGLITKGKIEELKEENTVLMSYYNLAEDKAEEGKEIEAEKLEVEKMLEEFSSLIELGDELEDKILKISKETEKHKAQLLVYEENKKELIELESRLSFIKKSLGSSIKIENKEDEIYEAFRDYENKLFELKGKVLDRKIVNSLEDLKSASLIRNLYYILIILGIIGSVALIFIKPVFSVVPLFFSGIFLISSFKYSQKIENLKKQKNEKEYIELLEININKIEAKLMGYGEELGLKSYEELPKALSEYKKYKDEMKTLERMIEERNRRLTNYNIEEVINAQSNNNKIIDRVLSYTSSKDTEELMVKIKELKLVKSRQEIVMHKWRTFNAGYEALKEDIDNREKSLNSKLKILKLDKIQLHELPKELEKLSEKISEKDKILLALNGVEDTYTALLKDRDLEHMKEELKEMLADSLEYSYESEEEVEEEIKLSQNKLLEDEKLLKDVENSVANRFLGIRSIISIEGDFQEISDKIFEYERELEALEIAKELLEESFKELQKNIGPVLNEKVAYYFNKLTNDKYTEVKVGSEYELLVREENGDIIKGDYLSNGTWDQVYLSLRLALIDMLFEDKKVPLIFDDAFIQYDDKRLENTLKIISDLSDKRQIILFSCQKREVNFLRNKANIINL